MLILHRNPLWMFFLGLVTLCALAYTGYAFFQLYSYQRLSHTAVPQKIDWSVLAMDEDHFIPQAHYQFTFQGKAFNGHTLLKEHYLNAWAAREAIDRLQSKPLLVWFNSNSPAMSTIEKNFPLKICLYTALLWGLLLYLAWLNQQVMHYKN
ncbi:Conserved putative membrane protein [Candidatus Protochlamydia naegleriophila]|uniref:Conserved putative membrane protein n=1 Tax=Candidatus Protochlamydia naegleriophila TaxID=389348 RepID=A0A0U5EUA8_9BACT|nr:hypothetical protein [Candidatus Protochlamydia naegleriophila]CUI17859.1 Conserved putative membrane protein [Candidatus Protochlamydia naegleriophila]